MHGCTTLRVGQHSHRFVEYMQGLHDQPCCCGPPPHPLDSLQTLFLVPFFFYHTGQENYMAVYASCLFDLSDTSFLVRMSVVYPQPLNSWQSSPPPPELFSCGISTLRRNPYECVLLIMRDSRGCISNGQTYVPPCWSFLLSKIIPSLASKSSKSTGTGFNIPITPSAAWTDLGRSQFLRHWG